MGILHCFLFTNFDDTSDKHVPQARVCKYTLKQHEHTFLHKQSYHKVAGKENYVYSIKINSRARVYTMTPKACHRTTSQCHPNAVLSNKVNTILLSKLNTVLNH